MDVDGLSQLLDVTVQSLFDAVEVDWVGVFHFGDAQTDAAVGPTAERSAEGAAKPSYSALQPSLDAVRRSGEPVFLDECSGEVRGPGATALFPVTQDGTEGAPPVAAAVLARRGGEAAFSRGEIRAARAILKHMPGATRGYSSGEYAYLESLFANASEAMVFLDLENRVLRINDEFTRLFGYTIEEIEGTHIDDLVASKATMREARDISRSVESGERVSRESVRVRKDGSEVNVSILGGPVFDRGETVGIFGIYRDITDQKRMMAALRKSEQRYREIFEQAPVGIFQTHSDGRALSVNRTFARMLGYESADDLMQVIGRSARAIYADPLTRDRFLSLIVQRGAVQNFSYEAVRRDGSRVYFSETSRISEWRSQSDFTIDGFVADVTELRAAQREVEEKERRLRGIFNAARDVALVLAESHTGEEAFRITEFSAGAERILGYRHDEVMGESLLELHPSDERDSMREKLRFVTDEKETVNEELQMMRRDGSGVSLLFTANPVFDWYGRVSGIVEVAVDITERKRAEWAIEESLREKEVLLQEIHHRVKNNMQIISSILSLETSHLSDPAIGDALQISQNRIRSMSLIHEKLYQSADLARVDLAEYVTDLAEELKSMSSDSAEFDLELDLEPILTNVDFAIPFGLIVNELCTNAFKHARTDGSVTRVKLQLGVGSEGTVLTVSDNGVGFPAEEHMDGRDSLGMELVRSLVSQIRGTIEYFSNNGAVWRVVVPPSA
ncbi:MAG: PAS domain S-box protein [Spirochaetota bacterium]